MYLALLHEFKLQRHTTLPPLLHSSFTLCSCSMGTIVTFYIPTQDKFSYHKALFLNTEL